MDSNDSVFIKMIVVIIKLQLLFFCGINNKNGERRIWYLIIVLNKKWKKVNIIKK